MKFPFYVYLFDISTDAKHWAEIYAHISDYIDDDDGTFNDFDDIYDLAKFLSEQTRLPLQDFVDALKQITKFFD